jgi:fluoride exporter
VGFAREALLVGTGGALGAIARWVVGTYIAARVGNAWPWGTFVINITGCLIIGFFVTLTSERVTVAEGWRYLVPIGFVGAYTTFSTYAFETVRLMELGHWLRAASYVLGSTVAGLIAVGAAMWVARRF